MTIDAARFQKLLNDFKLEQPVLRTFPALAAAQVG